MNSYTLTVTSKNQVTLPAEVVRRMSITKSQKLELWVDGDSLRLTPKPPLQDTMKKYAALHHARAPLATEDIKKTTADIISKEAAK